MEQSVNGLDGAKLTGGDWEWLASTNRAIALEYAIDPKCRDFGKTRGGQKLDAYFRRNAANYACLMSLSAPLMEFFQSIKKDGEADGWEPYWNNYWFPPIDAISLCLLLYNNKPTRYIEVGSGNSTKFARKLISHFGLATTIISIDPMPRAEIDQLCDTLIRQPLENLEQGFLEALSANDIFFIDSSHRSFQNSDVTVFFMEILPTFPDGLLYGLHDIFLPVDYVDSFLSRYYNEQYLLAAYLHGGARDDIIFSSAFVSLNHELFPQLSSIFSMPELAGVIPTGGCFWAKRQIC